MVPERAASRTRNKGAAAMNPSMPPAPAGAWQTLTQSPFLRLLVVGFLVILLQIPVAFIADLVGERSRTRYEAVEDISAKWGRGQEVFGPYLVVPYTYAVVEKDAETGNDRFSEHEAVAVFLPAELRIAAELETEVRRRGIFEMPAYSSAIRLEGGFAALDFSQWKTEPQRIDWPRAQLVFEISDVHAVQNRAALNWAGKELPFEPGTGLLASGAPGLHAPVPLAAASRAMSFAAAFELRGSFLLRFAPLAKNTEAALKADWPDPSFQGAYLPATSTIGPDGFAAEWRIPHLGRNYPQSWSRTEHGAAIRESAFGFDLLTPVDAYRQTERSLKYQILFLGLTFLAIWLFEALGGARLHPIQYLFIGAAMGLFYLLELALAEQLGFPIAYSLAAALVTGLVFFYAGSALDSRRRALAVAGVLAGLYACLYALLQLQDYALLAGSLGLFVILAAVMYATRNVDWYAARLAAPRPGEPPAGDR